VVAAKLDQSPRILVVEDEPALGSLIECVLEEEGYQPHLERRGDMALDAVIAEPPSAVILDLSLPGMNGLDVCREIRSRSLNIPVIMLTARDTVPDRVRGLDSGADDYLTKPFAIEELMARLRAQLRKSTANPEPIEIGDLLLDRAARLVSRAGIEVTLTAQEFGLLEFLMSNPNVVLTRQRILERVWGYDAAPASNVVDIYVHYLREKIDKGQSRKMIQTVRSVGYVLRT
jgi:two-component system OmpR family response regulator